MDIHELIALDLLHQIIKGTFKDHLIDWVSEYLFITHSDAQAKKILDDIDKQYVTQLFYLTFNSSTYAVFLLFLPSLVYNGFHKVEASNNRLVTIPRC